LLNGPELLIANLWSRTNRKHCFDLEGTINRESLRQVLVCVCVSGDASWGAGALQACLVFGYVLRAKIRASEVAFQKHLTTFIHIIEHHLRGGVIGAILNGAQMMIHVKQSISIVA
jgi:hypothetical protein